MSYLILLSIEKNRKGGGGKENGEKGGGREGRGGFQKKKAKSSRVIKDPEIWNRFFFLESMYYILLRNRAFGTNSKAFGKPKRKFYKEK